MSLSEEESRNVAILREAYQLWSESKATSGAHWMNLMADDVQFGSLADGRPGMEFTRSCGGKEDVGRYLAEPASDWEMLLYEAEEFVAQGHTVVMIGRCAWRHRRTGREVESPKVDVVRMFDGKIVQFYEFYDTAKAFAAANADGTA